MMDGLPTGTLTFLFTDIEGSTKRWESNPQAMSLDLARHDSILTGGIEARGGYIFKRVGDAFCAVFATVEPALQAALQIQYALQEGPWSQAGGPLRVRMALHVGAVEVRAGEYYGQPLNRIARLLSAGHGGQILLSDPTYDLLRDNLPAGVTFLDLGEHRLKDLIRPEHIFQVVAPRLPSAFPTLRALDAQPNNLPVQPTPLIGREQELADVCDMLRRPEVRLLTLTGPGGTGKTRLAMHAGAELLTAFKDGVWVVDLSTLRDPRLVVSAVAQVLGIRDDGRRPLLNLLKEYLLDKELLLVLDNFEQVVDAARDVGSLLAFCPHVEALVTSRMPLRVRIEHEYAVPPLSIPTADQLHHPQTLERLTQYEAVRLFIERAQAVKADFDVNNENAPAIAEICIRLDGLPLAIELAAARVRLFPPQSILSRLGSNLNLLSGGARDLPPRQQTLSAAIEWSYDLLTQAEQQFFRRMAVFRGGAILDALEAVCDYDAQLEIDGLEGVQSLLEKSLLRQRSHTDGEPVYWMYETVREYAIQKLQQISARQAEELRKQHALYFMALAERAEPHLTGPGLGEWLARLEDEHANLRAALDWAVEPYSPDAGDTRRHAVQESGPEIEGSSLEIGLRLAGSLWRFWYDHSHFEEGRNYLERMLSQVPADVPATDGTLAQEKAPSRSFKAILAKAIYGAGAMAVQLGNQDDTTSFMQRSLQLFRELGDKLGMAQSINGLALAASSDEDFEEAYRLHEQSLELCREAGHKRSMAVVTLNLGWIKYQMRSMPAAQAWYRQALDLAREAGDAGQAASTQLCEAFLLYDLGRYDQARALIDENLETLRRLGDRLQVAWGLLLLAKLDHAQGNFAGARALLQECLSIYRELGSRGQIIDTRLAQADVMLSAGDCDEARSLYEQVLEQCRPEAGARPYKRVISSALVGLGNANLALGNSDSALLRYKESLEISLELGAKWDIPRCLEGFARLAASEARIEEAARLWGAAEALQESTGLPLTPTLIAERQAYIEKTRGQVSAIAWAAAWAEGRAMTSDEAASYVLHTAALA